MAIRGDAPDEARLFGVRDGDSIGRRIAAAGRQADGKMPVHYTPAETAATSATARVFR